jgi:hypothetical protein
MISSNAMIYYFPRMVRVEGERCLEAVQQMVNGILDDKPGNTDEMEFMFQIPRGEREINIEGTPCSRFREVREKLYIGGNNIWILEVGYDQIVVGMRLQYLKVEMSSQVIRARRKLH